MALPILIDLSNYATLLKESQAGRDTTTGTATITADASGTYTWASNFLTLRFKPGQTVTVAGFVDPDNNGTKTIVSVTATVMTVAETSGMATEAGDGDEVITADDNGNIFFDTHNGRIELITKEELAQVDLGSGLEDNPLANQEGIFIGAVYAFERARRRVNEFLRQYDSDLTGTFKFAGAYELINGRKFATNGSITDDRQKLRGSGWLERLANGSVDRVYFGVRSLGAIEDTSQPYYQLTQGGAPSDFAKDGAIDEAIDVTGTVTFLSNKIRTFGFNYDEKTLVDSGISEMSGYSAGFALGETAHLTSGAYDLADVYGGGQIAPWTGMTLEKLASPRSEDGFTQGDGKLFTWVLNNTLSGTLNECVAFLDALAQTDDDIDAGTETVTNGKRVKTWYTYDAQGRVVTRSGADTLGLFIANIPTADQQRIVFTDDSAGQNTYPFFVDFRIVVGANAVADTNAWFHVWRSTGYGTPSAVTVLDAGDTPIKGTVSGNPALSGQTLSFSYNFDAEFPGQPTESLAIVVECEGDGVATQAKTTAAITRDAIVSVTCSPGLETNV
jgi:hypothetical protein